MDFDTFLPRAITGTLLLIFICLCLYMGATWLFALALIFGILALWELYTIFWGKECTLLKAVGIILAIFMIFTSWWGNVLLDIPGWSTRVIPVSIGASLLIFAVIFLYMFCKQASLAKINDITLGFFGLIYIIIPVLMALCLNTSQILLIFIVTIAADTLAYLAGNLWGRHKIWPLVSPNKSIEGAVAGLGGVIVVCLIFSLITDYFSTIQAFPIGLILAMAAMLGDFFESALKRSANIKDSGTLLPGHGGVLDRIDSFLFVVPTYHILQYILGIGN